MRRNKAFTLIELLVVIAIIGILAALIIVSLSGARAKAADTKIKNNARNIDTALAQYRQDQVASSYPNCTPVGMLVSCVVETALILPLTPYLTVHSQGQGAFSGYVTDNTHARYSIHLLPNSNNSVYAQSWQLNSSSEASIAGASNGDNSDAKNIAMVGNGVYNRGLSTGVNPPINFLGMTINGFSVYLDGCSVIPNIFPSNSRIFITYGPQ